MQSITLPEPSKTPPASTFVIRFWREWSAAGPRWRARVEHLQSGDSATAVNLPGIVGFIRRHGVMMEEVGNTSSE